MGSVRTASQEEMDAGHAVCDCGAFTHIFKSVAMRRLPAGYAGELCGRCSAWMSRLDKLQVLDAGGRAVTGGEQEIGVDDHPTAQGCAAHAKILREGAARLRALGESGIAQDRGIAAAFDARAGELEAAVKGWIDKQPDAEAAHALAHRQYWRFRTDGTTMPHDAGETQSQGR